MRDETIVLHGCFVCWNISKRYASTLERDRLTEKLLVNHPAFPFKGAGGANEPFFLFFREVVMLMAALTKILTGCLHRS